MTVCRRRRAQRAAGIRSDAAPRAASEPKPATARSGPCSPASPPTPRPSRRGARAPSGELATARQLARFLRRSDVILIHDRRIPGRGRANIDHLAIGPGGITVIDTKSTHGRVQLATTGIIHHREILLVNGRDRTRQLDALERQIDTVVARLARAQRHRVSRRARRALLPHTCTASGCTTNRARDGLIIVDDPAPHRQARQPPRTAHRRRDRVARGDARRGAPAGLRPAVRDRPEAGAPARATETSAPATRRWSSVSRLAPSCSASTT